MKIKISILFSLIVSAFGLMAATPPLRYNPVTTNLPNLMTNVIRDIAGPLTNGLASTGYVSSVVVSTTRDASQHYNTPPYDNAHMLPVPYGFFNDFYDSVGIVNSGGGKSSGPTEATITNNALLFQTNGLLSAGWNILTLDDMWAESTRDGSGQLRVRTNLFPNGIPWLAAFAHDHGFKLGMYLAYATNTCGYLSGTNTSQAGSRGYMSNDVAQLKRWNVDMVFVDTTCPGGITYDAKEMSQVMREVAQAATTTGADSDEGITNRGMIIRIDALRNSLGFSNSIIPLDVAYGANGIVPNGFDPADFGFEVKRLRPYITDQYKWVTRPGHYFDPLTTSFGGPTVELMKRFTFYSMFPMFPSMSYMSAGGWGCTNLTLGNGFFWTANAATALPALTNQYFWNLYRDPAVLPGRIAYSNALAEVWVRPIGATNSGTNLVMLMNLSGTSQNITLSNAWLNLADDASVVINDAWGTGTISFYESGWYTNTVTSSNAVALHVFAMPKNVNVGLFNLRHNASIGAGNVVQGDQNADLNQYLQNGNVLQGSLNANNGTNLIAANVLQGAENGFTAGDFGWGNVLQGYANLYGATNLTDGSVAQGYINLRQMLKGGRNVAMPWYSGTNLVEGFDNLFLGSASGVSTGTTLISHSTAIGAGATITASNQVVIGTSAETVSIPGAVSIGNAFSGWLISLSTNGGINSTMITNGIVWTNIFTP